MIVVDSGALFAALNPDQPRHTETRRALKAETQLILSPFILAELDYFITSRSRTVGPELAMLHEVATGRYELAPFTADDVALAASLVDRYADLGIGLADASIVVLAHRHRTKRVLTLDERHFRALRTLDGKPFELWPADR